MLRLIGVAALVALSATSASAQKIDAKGNCHGADGKMASASVCAHLKEPAYKLNAAGKCMINNVPGKKKGTLAKQDLCAAK